MIKYWYTFNSHFLILLKGAISSFFSGIIHLIRTQIFRKTKISYPLRRTRTYAHQGGEKCYIFSQLINSKDVFVFSNLAVS